MYVQCRGNLVAALGCGRCLSEPFVFSSGTLGALIACDSGAQRHTCSLTEALEYTLLQLLTRSLRLPTCNLLRSRRTCSPPSLFTQPRCPNRLLAYGTGRHWSMDDRTRSSSSPWRLLPTSVQLHVLSFLPHNARALSGRLAWKEAADAFSNAEVRIASLSQPLPPHAVQWAVEAGQQHVRQLPFRHKLRLLCTAAASGSEVNLEVALALLQPSIFQELLQDLAGAYRRQDPDPDPGVAAVKAGHPQLLRWLLHRCQGLLYPEHVMAAAAGHCDLAELQVVWGLLKGVDGHRSSSSSPHVPSLGQAGLNAAAASATPDAAAKMSWLLDAARDSCHLTEDTAVAATRSGDLGRLRWLQERGCPVGGTRVLVSALEHAHLPVVQWLVDEAGCCGLPGAEGTGWEQLLKAAIRSPVDGVGKLRWLQERGTPPLDVAQSLVVQRVALEAVEGGQVEVVRYLLPAVLRTCPHLVPFMAAISGSIPMVECLREAGSVRTNTPYRGAARAGNVAMVRWLAQQQERVFDLCSVMGDVVDVIKDWPTTTSADSRSLLEAVQVVLGTAEDRDPGAAGAVFGQEAANWSPDAVMQKFYAIRAASLAAERGDAALVRYLMTRLRPTPQLPGDGARKAAVNAGCEAMLEWLAESKPDFRERPSPGCMYLEAAGNGDRGTLTALRQLGVPWGVRDTLAEAVRQGCCEPALRWLVQQGVPVGGAEEVEAAVQAAVRDQGLGAEAAAWLRGLAAGRAAAASGEG